MFHLLPGLAEYKTIQITLFGLDFVLFASFCACCGSAAR